MIIILLMLLLSSGAGLSLSETVKGYRACDQERFLMFFCLTCFLLALILVLATPYSKALQDLAPSDCPLPNVEFQLPERKIT